MSLPAVNPTLSRESPGNVSVIFKPVEPLVVNPPNHNGQFNVYIREKTLELRPAEFLTACWTDLFDTPCSVCSQDFDIAVAPPVRTLRLRNSQFDEDSPLTAKLPPLVIFNTHLECIKVEGIKYIPISHAWHQPVADAYEYRTSNPAAVKMIYEMPLRILIAAARRFGPKIHIWHDYISIPQWQDSFRGPKILPQIFQIFEFGQVSLIHIDETPAIQTLRSYTPESFRMELSNLRHLFSARWFCRMWMVMEYDISPDAYLVNSNYEIMSNTLFTLATQITGYHNACVRECRVNPSPTIIEALKWIEEIPLFVKERVRKKCLGYVFDMIGSQGCRSHRDRFVAACALLENLDLLSTIREMPSDPQQACLWVSRRCLQSNDYSPLLLCSSGETEYEDARWLKGHSTINTNMWGWAVQTQAAHTAPQFRGNKMILRLNLQGLVVKHLSWRNGGAESSFGFTEILPHALNIAAGSVKTFLALLERIYPSEIFWVLDGDQYKFPGLHYRHVSTNKLEQQLRDLLDFYENAKFQGAKIDLEKISEQLVSMIFLSEKPTTSIERFRDINRLQLYSLICPANEHHLISVCCGTCSKSTSFRATLWEDPGKQAHLYQIPGLAYVNSVPEGTGIVVEGGKIIGRVRFGHPACFCNTGVLIELS